VYVLTNPLMPGLCKIGITHNDLEVRMKQLFSSGVPVPFECYYAAKVPDAAWAEKLLHHAFGDLRVNPTREFFRIDPERGSSALKLAGGTVVTPKSDVVDKIEDLAALNLAKKKALPFTFPMVNIPIGSTLVSTFSEHETCQVFSENKVLFGGTVMSLSAAALNVAHKHGYTWTAIQGPLYWQWNGKTLNELRQETIEGVEDEEG
jgi:hypothetical protein